MGYSDPATVAINVLPINDDFLANDDTYSIPSGLTLHPAAPALLANDTAPEGVSFTAVLADGPAHASEFTLNSDGSFTYKSANAYVGPDSFTYEITDGQATSYAATVSITVEDDPDIAITAFYSDGITLQVQYVASLRELTVGPFSIGIYKSYDGVNPVGGPLETADAITSAGVHTVPITATFVDPQERITIFWRRSIGTTMRRRPTKTTTSACSTAVRSWTTKMAPTRSSCTSRAPRLEMPFGSPPIRSMASHTCGC